jgi:hypothetical protein
MIMLIYFTGKNSLVHWFWIKIFDETNREYFSVQENTFFNKDNCIQRTPLFSMYLFYLISFIPFSMVNNIQLSLLNWNVWIFDNCLFALY